MGRDVSSAIWFYFSDAEPGKNQLQSMSLIEAVDAMEWRMQTEMSQSEADALNIYLNMHEKNQIDYFNNVVYPHRCYG